MKPVPKSSCASNNLKTSQNQVHRQTRLDRYEALKADYPGCENFFAENKEEILWAMRDVLSETELADVSGNAEVFQNGAALAYNYMSSSIHAAEDIIIEHLDLRRDIKKRYEN